MYGKLRRYKIKNETTKKSDELVSMVKKILSNINLING